MKILNYGSINVDHVYSVDHISRAGETLAARCYQVFAGGKGANQSAALALAGAVVYHAGRVGQEGTWVVDKLAGLGVDVRHVTVHEEPTGHASIQVDPHGQNSIVIYAGANEHQDMDTARSVLRHFEPGDMLLLQNEINGIYDLIDEGSKFGLRVVYNPAPAAPWVRDLPLHLVDTIILNQTEATALTGADDVPRQLEQMASNWPSLDCVLTLGTAGMAYRGRAGAFALPAVSVAATDTTGAGDTFIGYYLAAIAGGMTPEDAAARAVKAAALCVCRPGAMDSIPAAAEVR